MTTRHQQEVVRQWLMNVKAANDPAAANFAAWALEWIDELVQKTAPHNDQLTGEWR